MGGQRSGILTEGIVSILCMPLMIGALCSKNRDLLYDILRREASPCYLFENASQASCAPILADLYFFKQHISECFSPSRR